MGMATICISHDNILTTWLPFCMQLNDSFSSENMKTKVNIQIITKTDYCTCPDSSWFNCDLVYLPELCVHTGLQ